MYRIEWDDGFEGINSTAWMDNVDFIRGMYQNLVSKGHKNVRIMEKSDVTEEFLKNKVE